METIDSFRGQYGFLSNFDFAKAILEGVEYPTSEHAFQAAKFLSIETRLYVRDLASPADTKRFAKEMYSQGKTRADWLTIRDSVMFMVLMSKFSNPILKARLLGTGDAQLIEGNTWHDCYWGACTCPRCQGRPKVNRLGQLLMLVRAVYAHGMENEAIITTH